MDNSVKMTKRQRQASDTRRKIYSSAILLFKERGYFETTTRDIAEASGVSQGLIFNYFKTKEDFLVEMFSKPSLVATGGESSRFADLEAGNRKGEAFSAVERLRMFIESTMEAFRDELGYKFTGVIIGKRCMYNNNLDYFKDMDKIYHTQLKDILEDCIKSGEFRESTNAEELFEVIVQYVIRGSLMKWCFEKGEIDLIGQANIILDIVIKAHLCE